MKYFLLALVITFTACAHTDPVNPAYPTPETGGAVYCPEACKQARSLGCPLGKNTPGGKTCEEVCKKYTPPASAGLRPECIRDSKDCQSMDQCTY